MTTDGPSSDPATPCVYEFGTLVAYHGTAYSFDRFDPNLSPPRRRGIYFSWDPEVASRYAEIVGSVYLEIPEIWGIPACANAGVVYPVYLRIANPYFSDWRFWSPEDDLPGVGSELQKARSRGHDGVVFVGMETNDMERGMIVVFDPDQVRSIFDPDMPRLHCGEVVRRRAGSRE